MRAPAQLAPRAEYLDDESYQCYIRAARFKAEETRYRSGLLKTGTALAFGAAVLIYLFIHLNHHLL